MTGGFPLPQPIPPAIATKSSSASITPQLRRRGKPKKNTPANAIPPAASHPGLARRPRTTGFAVAAIVLTVTVAVPAAPLILTLAGTEQLGGTAAAGVTAEIAQVSDTVPVNPLTGLTVSVVEFPVVAPTLPSVIVDGLVDIVYVPAAATTVTLTALDVELA
jgi:hypothetical protein